VGAAGFSGLGTGFDMIAGFLTAELLIAVEEYCSLKCTGLRSRRIGGPY